MFENEKFDRLKQWILIITFIVFTIIFALFVYELIDFHNDYVCNTTTNIEWFEAHNCSKYFNN